MHKHNLADNNQIKNINKFKKIKLRQSVTNIRILDILLMILNYLVFKMYANILHDNLYDLKSSWLNEDSSILHASSGCW